MELDDMRAASVVREDIDNEVLAAIDSADYTMNSLQDRFVSLQVCPHLSPSIPSSSIMLMCFSSFSLP
jgi:hypothetical protein